MARVLCQSPTIVIQECGDTSLIEIACDTGIAAQKAFVDDRAH